jgi:hypothetical protein
MKLCTVCTQKLKKYLAIWCNLVTIMYVNVIHIKYRYKKIFAMLRKDMLADIVPVDIPINLMCCVAWR